MKILVAFAVIMLVSAQVFAAEIGLNEEPDWYNDQIQEDLPVFENFLQRIARKPSPDRFYGLMGKRNNGFGQMSRKRFGPISRKQACMTSDKNQEHNWDGVCQPIKGNARTFMAGLPGYKSDSFYGLMGKRSLLSGSAERNTIHNYERRRK